MNVNIQSQIQEFLTQAYPTVEQTIANNSSVLYKRKKFFLEELRQMIKFLGFTLIVIVYLRDISMLRLLIRVCSQFSISNPFPAPSTRVSITEESKRALTRFLLMCVFVSNGFCFLVHLIFGAYQSSNFSSQNLHGGMSIQFIGERLPYSTIELLVYDALILFIQLLFHSLMCITDDSDVLHQRVTNNYERGFNIDKSEIVSDGYNGDVELITIDLYQNIKTALEYTDRFQYYPTASTMNDNTAPMPTPGMFV